MLWQKGVWMDPDMNKYDLEHVTTGHARMTQDEWQKVYRQAWSTYYTPRAHGDDPPPRRALGGMACRGCSRCCASSRSAVPIEGVHPLQGGFLRLKYRRDRRPGLPIEPVWAFYPKYGWEMCRRVCASACAGWTIDRM